MSYEPTNWKTGDVVTSEKLNKLENGVANSGDLFVVKLYYDAQQDKEVCDKTWEELNAIYDGDTETFRKPIYAYIADGDIAIGVFGNIYDSQGRREFMFWFLTFTDAHINNEATAYRYLLNIDNVLDDDMAYRIAVTPAS